MQTYVREVVFARNGKTPLSCESGVLEYSECCADYGVESSTTPAEVGLRKNPCAVPLFGR